MQLDLQRTTTVSSDLELDEFDTKILYGTQAAIKAEIAELRRLKLPIFQMKDGKPYDHNPDTNPNPPIRNKE